MHGGRRYEAIDMLRILAAASVVVFHYFYFNPAYAGAFSRSVRSAASYGYLGVQLFFMISGYVITLSAIGRRRSEFALARFVRLWPAFVMCLVLTVSANAMAGSVPQLPTVLANLTMMPRLFGVANIDGVYWSLMFEILFYVAVAVLLVGGPNFVGRLRVFAVVWLMLAVAGLFVRFGKLGTLFALEFAPYFIVGIAVFLVRNAGNWARDRALLAVAVLVAVVFAVIQADGVGDAEFSAASEAEQSGMTLRVRPNAWICALIIVASTMALLGSTVVEVGPRLARVAFVLGGVSYPLYLLHNSFGSVLVNWTVERMGVCYSLLLGVGIVTTVCYLVWKMEVPLRKRLLGFAKTPSRRPDQSN
jgi:peptidoglycan/LPS O-acetylase OafA/YrhL